MTRNKLIRCGLLTVAFAAIASTLSADSNIDTVNKFAWGENIGWLNWRDANAGTQGVEVLADHTQGFIWGENVGWLNTGNGGGPYLNTNGTNFGVNIAPTGELSGFAWGENIGWINFDTLAALGAFNQEARYDAGLQRFFGYAWGENVGWINLDDTIHFVGVSTACDGDANGDGAVDVNDIAYVIFRFGTCVLGGTPCTNGCDGDANGDGVVDVNDISYVIFRLGTCNPQSFPCP